MLKLLELELDVWQPPNAGESLVMTLPFINYG
jgi:hypothetical protein